MRPVFLVIFLILFIFPASVRSASLPQTQDTTVSASIGDYVFSLSGYSSPNALVTIEGMGIYDQTRTNSNGFFRFTNRFSPFSPREACLRTQDQLGRLSTASCIPPFPTKYNVSIGPVLLPATVSLNKNNYYIGDEVVLSGQTIPNTKVNLSMFSNNKGIKGKILSLLQKFQIIKPVEAVNLPVFEAQSDSEGNFSIALPSSMATSYRIFARTKFEEDFSPQSLMLNLNILPWWMIIIKFLLFILFLLKSRLVEIVIISEIIILSYYIFKRYFHPYQIKALAIREHNELLVISKERK